MSAEKVCLNKMEREALYRIREIFAEGREASLTAAQTEEDNIRNWSEAALYPEKPILSFCEEAQECEKENTWYPKEENMEFFRLAENFKSETFVQRLITCGGVDDGKSTLIGKILYETKTTEEQKEISSNPSYLRKDHSIDYALLAGSFEEERQQGITVQVSYSVFGWKRCRFLMADVPGHEEYTRNMAYAASKADTAIIMIGANKGIVPQTKRHTRICYFMGIRNMIFAVNKMDMVSFEEKAFIQLAQEITRMMEYYPECRYTIVPVAAKTGVNITQKAKEMPWYKGESLLNVLEETVTAEIDREAKHTKDAAERFCMPVQRVCKSSQMQGAVIKKRVFQGEIAAGEIQTGDEIFVYPTGERAKVTGLYYLKQSVDKAFAGMPVGIELDRELDVARGYILTGEDMLTSTDRIEADILWTSDSRLTQGKRYQVKIGTALFTAVVTRICYQIDVNTGEHRYAESLTKNALARCELCFSKQIPLTCEQINRKLGTLELIDRKFDTVAAYGNVMQTISEEVWKENGQEISASEREKALGQKAGMLLFPGGEKAGEHMNFIERYLLRMGFHTIQIVTGEMDERELEYIRKVLDSGLIVLLLVDKAGAPAVRKLLPQANRIFDCSKAAEETKDAGVVLKQIKQWASALI